MQPSVIAAVSISTGTIMFTNSSMLSPPKF